jgi:flagellar protein FlaJ
MNFDLEEQKLIIERYLFIIKNRYNIKREYLTIGVPIFIAVLFLLSVLLTGHTFPAAKGNNTANTEAAGKMGDYERLIASMESEETGNATESAENVTRAGTLPLEDKSKDDMDQMLVIAFIIATMPYSIDVLLQKRRLKKQEVAFSQFLYKLSELMRGGIDPVKGIIALSRGELGAIKKEVQDCASSLVLGHSLEYSMNRLNKAIGSRLIGRYINIIVEAAHTGGNVADLIFRTSEDMRAVLTLEREKEGNLKQYTVVFYLAQGIVIMLIYVLSGSLLPLVQGTGLQMIGGTNMSDINFTQGFFHMIILNALLGGMIIGMITEGDLKQGLKHSNVLVAGSYIVCAVIILPVPAPLAYNITVASGEDQFVMPGLSPKEPIVFNVTEANGKPAKRIEVKMSISPAGTVSSGTTNSMGLVRAKPVLPQKEGIYILKATAGRSYNSTNVTVRET